MWNHSQKGVRACARERGRVANIGATGIPREKEKKVGEGWPTSVLKGGQKGKRRKGKRAEDSVKEVRNDEDIKRCVL